MKRCTLVVPDAGPFNSLWVAERLDLFLALDMKVVVVDAVYDEITRDMTYAKDREVKSFIDANSPPFIIEPTEYGQFVRERRAAGGQVKKGAGDAAIAEFMASDTGLRKHLGTGDPVLLLYEDRDLRVINRPPNLHLLSTVGMLRGLERVRVIPSADDVIHAMTHPGGNPASAQARKFTDLPDGADEPAAIGSSWEP
jgi:hypothetical protein